MRVVVRQGFYCSSIDDTGEQYGMPWVLFIIVGMILCLVQKGLCFVRGVDLFQ